MSTASRPHPQRPRPLRPTRAERIQAALLHFEIAMRTYASGLYVDWGDTCVRMARALAPEGEGLDQLGGRITFRPLPAAGAGADGS